MNNLLTYGLVGLLTLYSFSACRSNVPDTSLSEKNNPFVMHLEYDPKNAFQDYEQVEPVSITGTVLTSYISGVTTNTSELGTYQLKFTMIGFLSGEEKLNLIYPGIADLSSCKDADIGSLLRFKTGTVLTNNKLAALFSNNEITYYEINGFDALIQGPLGEGYVNGLILK
ncbi:MAG: hypothetical protein AABW92_05595, partial [Nanoarchaeota archaeon]